MMIAVSLLLSCRAVAVGVADCCFHRPPSKLMLDDDVHFCWLDVEVAQHLLERLLLSCAGVGAGAGLFCGD